MVGLVSENQGAKIVNFDRLSDTQYVMIASPEKAICDKIITTRDVRFRSIKNAYEFLIENLRLDESGLRNLNTVQIENWVLDSPKSESLRMLIKFIQEL
ncbi:hypothetical protein GCM10008106_30710 [Mongoliitalea lutea]|uniref:Uncharacterized protein n=1 Tax=Mongoliitalea lutea TaxID=849756 RepID=A0A8J3D0E3_9BACT|nr:hypothetical protein GCM10008106_30710 [Mongoliitalea lutea]